MPGLGAWAPSPPTFVGVPSKDSNGKRLSGGATRRQAQEHAAARAQLATVAPALAARLPGGRGVQDADDAGPPQPLNVPPPPPPSAGAAAGVEWASIVMAQAALLAASRGDPPRVRALQAGAKSLGALLQAAQDSEETLTASRAYGGALVEFGGDAPPEDPAGLCAWAFWAVVRLLHVTATQPDAVDEAQVRHAGKSYEALRLVRPQAALDRHAAQAERAMQGGRLGVVR